MLLSGFELFLGYFGVIYSTIPNHICLGQYEYYYNLFQKTEFLLDDKGVLILNGNAFEHLVVNNTQYC